MVIVVLAVLGSPRETGVGSTVLVGPAAAAAGVSVAAPPAAGVSVAAPPLLAAGVSVAAPLAVPVVGVSDPPQAVSTSITMRSRLTGQLNFEDFINSPPV